MIPAQKDDMLTRRSTLALASAATLAPRAVLARAPKEVMWDDLIPFGVPYSEIVGDGEIDFESDTWKPQYDANATKFNTTLEGAYVRIPGYIIPFVGDANGITEFLLVPYVGACIHVPPPPANQLVYVRTEEPWPTSGLWEAIWVTGTMSLELQDTTLATIGYALRSDDIEVYK